MLYKDNPPSPKQCTAIEGGVLSRALFSESETESDTLPPFYESAAN